MRSYEWTGDRCRKSVITGHRTCLKNALATYALSEDQRRILQAVSDRIGLHGEGFQPDVIGTAPDREPRPAGLPPQIGPGTFANIRRSGEFMQAQPWLVRSVELLVEWELRSIGRLPVRQLLVAQGASLEELWKPLCAWAAPLRRDRQGWFRLARRAAEYLLGTYPWDAEWTEDEGDLPTEVREALERESNVILDYARDTGCHCGACVSRRREVAVAREQFPALRNGEITLEKYADMLRSTR